MDGIATLLKTPSLTRESNSIARALLDSGHSVDFVVSYGLIAQVAFITLICVLKMNAVYAEFLPSNPPARSAIQVAALPRGAEVEIECVAVLDE